MLILFYKFFLLVVALFNPFFVLFLHLAIACLHYFHLLLMGKIAFLKFLEQCFLLRLFLGYYLLESSELLLKFLN
jgi:hypothetical protein